MTERLKIKIEVICDNIDIVNEITNFLYQIPLCTHKVYRMDTGEEI